MTTPSSPALRADAELAADRALGRAGVSVRDLESTTELERAASLLRTVWQAAADPVPTHVLRAIRDTGGYVFGAYDTRGGLSAVSVALLAADGLHSHVTGVVPSCQGRGLGYALKQHQRVWALNRGITTITWTCDPLVRRNVAFNLHALGATVEKYLTNHYGSLGDGLNSDDASDRFKLRWELLSARADLAGRGHLPFVATQGIPVAVTLGSAGLPVVRPTEGFPRLVELPRDIEELRRSDPVASAAWRQAVREALVLAMESGGAVLGLGRTGELVVGRDDDRPATARIG